MSNDERFWDLADAWEQLRTKGAAPPVEELCVADPDLTERIRQWTAALEATAWMCRQPADDSAYGCQSSAEPPHAEGAGGTNTYPPPLVEGYEILSKIGQGGMGTVYRARHEAMNRLVALKIMTPTWGGTAEAVERFNREMRVVAQLVHPNIVMAFDGGRCAAGHFLAMELVEGVDLARHFTQCGPLPVPEALGYIVQAARGLQFAHFRGVVHRDVKPSNLLLDASGSIKVSDFGLARWNFPVDSASDGGSLTVSGRIQGTLDYMAPEQARSLRSADHRADIYSLGATLHFLLTGRAMFAGDTIVERLVAPCEQPAPVLGDSRNDVPPRLEAAFQKMVAKRPEDRFQSMHELIAALEACSTSSGQWPLLSSRSRGNLRRRILWGGLGALLLAGGAAAIIWATSIRQHDSPTGLRPANVASASIESAAATARRVPASLDSFRAQARRRKALDDERFGHRVVKNIDSDYATAKELPWKSAEQQQAYQRLLEQYPQSNQAGCACYELGEITTGVQRNAYLRRAMDEFADCWFYNGTQVGPAAMYMLVLEYRRLHDATAEKLERDLKARYPQAIYGDDSQLIATLLSDAPKSGKTVSPALVPLQAQAKDRMVLDTNRFGQALSKKIEADFQVGNKYYPKPESRRPLEQVLASYPQSNRAGCACLYLGRMSQGSEAIRYYKMAIEKYDDCWYGDGTQVGPMARYLLAHLLRKDGRTAEAEALEKELLTHYPDAVLHGGVSLTTQLTKVATPGSSQRSAAYDEASGSESSISPAERE